MLMYAPPHPGEMIRDILEDEDVGWTVTECARKHGSEEEGQAPPGGIRVR